MSTTSDLTTLGNTVRIITATAKSTTFSRRTNLFKPVDRR
jgi:hypothetical protein